MTDSTDRYRAQRRCDGVARRDFLCVGSLLGLGLGWGGLTRLAPSQSAAAAGTFSADASARHCILIWLDGGPSHLETWDPKPDAPVEVRGPFEAISTSVAGVAISELLPQMARWMHRVALVRSVTSPLGEHNLGTHYMLTGYPPTPALAYPVFGSVSAQLRPTPTALPHFVAVPDMRVGGANLTPQGFLGSAVAPFETGGDPSRTGFRVQNLAPYPGVTEVRLARRREYLRQLDQFARRADEASDVALPEAFQQAYRMTTSDDVRGAFDLEAEAERVRNRYGRKSIGQSCLLARRLVERGVPFVTVNSTGWDTHTDLVLRLKEGFTGASPPVGLIPSLDMALASLLEDLSDRGLLEQTLVIVMGEFGRTPKLNTAGGRDHWPRVFSVLLAGGGVPGGVVVGESDSMGESPAKRPVTPADLASTIYRLLGLDSQSVLHTPDGRPVRLATGQEVSELCG